ncbi:hypothetical protein FACS189413_00810 [Bacteroidia bacterium]|nr:hypothetical protein FACS189463_2450 [Bacteroidia bacterium]GHU66929.1 hypothetical protein FACS189413_00810 [Bacteroidia bacterium]
MKPEVELSEWPQLLNYGFLIFLSCFFFSAQLIGNGRKLVVSMFYDLFHSNERQNLFSETVKNELIGKYFLCLQAFICGAFLISGIYIHNSLITWITGEQWFQTCGISFLGVSIWIIYKYLVTNLIGFVFFENENIRQWNHHFLSITALSGLILFPPAVCLFFLPGSYPLCFWFGVIYLIFVEILTAWKIYTIFFQQNRALLHFILYLCAQELMPLYWLYRALTYFFY